MKIFEFLERNGTDVWTRNAVARNSWGERVGVHSSKAVCWCSEGLAEKFYPDSSKDVLDALGSAIGERPGNLCDMNGKPYIGAWNDEEKTSFTDVVAAFKKAGK